MSAWTELYEASSVVGPTPVADEVRQRRAARYTADTALRQGWSNDDLAEVLGALGLLPEVTA